MTVEDLMMIYDAAIGGARRMGQQHRVGVTAIVRALRDELNRVDWDLHESAIEVLDEILGSDAGEKVGTHGSPELDEDARKLEAMGQDPGMTLEELLAPATDAAPDVCVWIDQVKGMAWAGCNNKLYPIKSAVNGCNGCGKPIKFTEAK